MAEADSTLENKLLRKFYPKLRAAILHPAPIAGELYGLEMIDETTKQELTSDKDQSADILLRAIEAYFTCSLEDESRRRSFMDLMNVLSGHIPLNKVVEQILKQYSKMSLSSWRKIGNAHATVI